MASTISRVKSFGCEVVKRTRRIPSHFGDGAQQIDETQVRAAKDRGRNSPSGRAVEFPCSRHRQAGALRARTDSLGRLRSGPRVCGTTQ